MQKCAMFKDWKSVHSIFKLLLSNHNSNSTNVKPDIVSFNIFINCMALSDLFKSEKCLQILQIMQSDKYAIKHDIITFSSLIICIKAEQCWHLLKSEKYRLPNWPSQNTLLRNDRNLCQSAQSQQNHANIQ